MRKLHELSKNIKKSAIESNQNSKRIQENYPRVDRKLDVVSGMSPFKMEIPLSDRNHSMFLNLSLKPDNCCDCFMGLTPGVMLEGVAYHTGFSQANAVPSLADYISPMTTTGSEYHHPFWWGYPWYYPTLPHYPYASYSLGPNGIVIPKDGIYSIVFKNHVTGTATEDISSIRAEIRVNYTDIISSRTLSVRFGTLNQGYFEKFMNLSALCIPLKAGDEVGAYWTPTEISAWTPRASIFGNPSDATKIYLTGLGTSMLIGFVADIYGVPIGGASVYIDNFYDTVLTDIYGYYVFYSLAPGNSYSVTVTENSYVTQTRSVVTSINAITSLDFTMVHI